MIRIKSGTCGTSQGYKTSESGPLTLPVVEEKRLVGLGVAVYVAEKIIEEPTAAEPEGSDLSRLTVAKLKELAEELGVDTAECRTKSDYIAALSGETSPAE